MRELLEEKTLELDIQPAQRHMCFENKLVGHCQGWGSIQNQGEGVQLRVSRRLQ